MTISRDEIRAALRSEDVAQHLGIKLRWSGRWGRGRQCAIGDHGSDAFGLARDGNWHCHAHDDGGDLIKLVALGEGLDLRTDFGKILEICAAIAGVETGDDFGGVMKPPPIARPPAPDIEPIESRLATARKRAAWVWERMGQRVEGSRSIADMYLGGERGLPVEIIRTREDIRTTPFRVTSEQTAKHENLRRLARMFAVPGVALPVRSPRDGALVDIRVRRVQPAGEQPKIVGMLGGVTSSGAVDGKGRELLGCYGFPHDLRSDMIVVVEGAVDYLTALAAWPSADVLGAVAAGDLSLVALHAAQSLAARDEKSMIMIVEQDDGFGKAGDRSVNEDPNAATKVAVRVLGPRRVGWVFCGGKAHDGKPLKDLNDMWRTHTPIKPAWWSELGEAVA